MAVSCDALDLGELPDSIEAIATAKDAAALAFLMKIRVLAATRFEALLEEPSHSDQREMLGYTVGDDAVDDLDYPDLDTCFADLRTADDSSEKNSELWRKGGSVQIHMYAHLFGVSVSEVAQSFDLTLSKEIHVCKPDTSTHGVIVRSVANEKGWHVHYDLHGFRDATGDYEQYVTEGKGEMVDVVEAKAAPIKLNKGKGKRSIAIDASHPEAECKRSRSTRNR